MKVTEGTGSRATNETVIVFDDANDIALITTCSPKIHRKLQKLGHPVGERLGNGEHYRITVPQRCISLRGPQKRPAKRTTIGVAAPIHRLRVDFGEKH